MSDGHCSSQVSSLSRYHHVVKSLVAEPVPALFMQRSHEGSLMCVHSEEDHFGYGAINDSANQNAWIADQSTDLRLRLNDMCAFSRQDEAIRSGVTLTPCN